MKSRVVSVIIPVYNANKYLEKCLTSTINQTLKNIEIICIDNNSKDNSTEIIKKLQKKDNRIKLLHERQQGAGPARNKGMDYATGEYVFFLDPDDEIYSKQTLEKLYNIAKDKNMNIVGGSVEIIDANTGKETKGEDEFYFKKEGIINYKDYQYDWGFWRFIYNNQFLKDNKIEFPPYLRGQDTVFFVKAMIAANKFYAIKEPTYIYNFKFTNNKHTQKTYDDYELANQELLALSTKYSLTNLYKKADSHRISQGKVNDILGDQDDKITKIANNTNIDYCISIIIPTYNASKTLQKSIDSCMSQTLKNIEIICIDNNSKDNSTEIIKKLQKKDNRIRLFHEKKQGAGPARNKGLKHARGEYVFFLDPDDEIYSKQTLEKLYNIAKDKNMNIVGGSVEIIDANTGKETKGEDEFYFKKEGIINYKDYQYDWGFTRFIYNNQFLKGNDIKFPSYLRGEDPVFFVKAMIAANKFYAIKEPTYVYNFTHSSKKHSIQSNTDYNRSSLDVIKLAHANKLMRLEEIVKKHDRPLVSIIIPVYSTAPDHLHRCFTSILNQAYSNTEVIIVDDGSNKKTAKFIDSFIKHTQWKLIRQENKGLSAARNAGYKVAAGKYIQFLDSDDYFDRYLIAYGVEFAKKDDADIVIENFTIKTADTGDERDVLDLGRLPNKTTFRLKQIEDNKLDTIAFSVWSKLFKKSFLDKHNILYDEELFRAEDVLYSLTALILADKITVLPKSLITYLEDMPGSNTATNDKHATASVKSWDKLHSFLIDKKLFEFYRKDFESAALGSITWSLDRMYTLNGIQELGIVASRFINNLNFDTSDTRVVLLKVASKCPEAILLLRKKDKELLEKDAHIIKQNEKINSVESELLSYLGIKRSVKLTAGNIKRRIKKLLR